VPVPINCILARDNFTYIFEDENPAVVVYDEGVAERAEPAREAVVRPPDAIRVGKYPADGTAYENLFDEGNENSIPAVQTDPGMNRRVRKPQHPKGTNIRVMGTPIRIRLHN